MRETPSLQSPGTGHRLQQNDCITIGMHSQEVTTLFGALTFCLLLLTRKLVFSLTIIGGHPEQRTEFLNPILSVEV